MNVKNKKGEYIAVGISRVIKMIGGRKHIRYAGKYYPLMIEVDDNHQVIDYTCFIVID